MTNVRRCWACNALKRGHIISLSFTILPQCPGTTEGGKFKAARLAGFEQARCHWTKKATLRWEILKISSYGDFTSGSLDVLMPPFLTLAYLVDQNLNPYISKTINHQMYDNSPL